MDHEDTCRAIANLLNSTAPLPVCKPRSVEVEHKNCGVCGQRFKPARRVQKFCSHDCKYVADVRNRPKESA